MKQSFFSCNGQQSRKFWFDKAAFRIFVFLIIGIAIFCVLGHIFKPKHFPYDKVADAAKFEYYYNEEKDSIDALILGTSHPSRGILPMEMYELYGIKSYNLANSLQSIEASYYTLQEAIKSQHPQIVIWDVSNLYISEVNEAAWRLAIDEIALGKNKVLLTKEYLKKIEDTRETTINLLFPLLEYHTRWKELSKQDFNFKICNLYYGKGGEIYSSVTGAVSAEKMNSMVNDLLRNNEKVIYEYNRGVFSEKHEENVLYSTEIPSTNIEWFYKIKKLCDINDIQLLAIKVPTVKEPQWNNSAWSIEKYKKVKAFCDENGVAYYDLLYDTDVGFDWNKDSSDGGYHLNLYGAQKLSLNLGSYLKEHYELSDERNEQWDRDLILYKKVCKIALLQLEQEFVTYINMLADEYKENTIFITVSDEMTQGLSEADVSALRNLGLQMDYTKALQHSYIAIIENGEVKYEALSSRPLNYNGICNQSGKQYELYSSGWWTTPKASIKIDEKEYAINTRGLNIVVYDNKRDLVLDSVAFDTWAEYHPAIRNNSMTNRFEEAFEQYIMEVEDK